MTNILLVDNFKIFEKWASKTYQYKIDKLKEDDKFKVIDINKINEINLDDYKTIILGWNMCIYSKYYTLKQEFYSKKIQGLENFSEIKNKTVKLLEHKNKYLIVQDFINKDDYEYGLNSLISYLKEYNFKGIITPYLNTTATNPLKNELPNLKFIHIPHHIDENKFKDWGLEKNCDIFLFGNCVKSRYPFRNRLVQILESLKNKYNIVLWNNLMTRNYFRFNPKISNENLSKQINKSWLCICTKSYANVLLGKYMETSMSSSCVLGNMPTDGKEIWKNNYIHIDENMTDNEIIKIIENALKDKNKLQNNIKIMKEQMNKFYLSNFPNRIYQSLQ